MFYYFLKEYIKTLHDENDVKYNIKLNLFRILFNIFMDCEYTIKNKFNFLNYVFENIFISEEDKEIFLKHFCNIQRSYFYLIAFKNICMLKKLRVAVETDLFLNKITPKMKNVISIYQNKRVYLFKLCDLINIINKSLLNSTYFFCNPLTIKNPYNNLPFNKSTLYNIYFAIKKSDYIFPELFHKFFLVDFNFKKFIDYNEHLIRYNYIDDYINNSSIGTICHIIKKQMLYQFNKTFPNYNIKIDDEFPREKLIKIMRPYLRLYLISEYSLVRYDKINFISKLNKCLLRFSNYNRTFGKKNMKYTQIYSFKKQKYNVKKEIAFNEKCIKYRFMEDLLYRNYEYFLSDHIVNLDDDYEENYDSHIQDEQQNQNDIFGILQSNSHIYFEDSSSVSDNDTTDDNENNNTDDNDDNNNDDNDNDDNNNDANNYDDINIVDDNNNDANNYDDINIVDDNNNDANNYDDINIVDDNNNNEVIFNSSLPFSFRDIYNEMYQENVDL